MSIIAFIQEPKAIDKIIRHLGFLGCFLPGGYYGKL
jgi:hypothetical protein